MAKSLKCRNAAMAMLAMISLAACDSANPSPNISPAAVMSMVEAPEIVHLGEVRPGEEIPYQFKIHNTSTTYTVKIPYIASSCGCTTTSSAPIAIAPGKDAVINGVFTIDESILKDRAVSAVWIGVDNDAHHTVILQAEIVRPLSEAVTITDFESIRLPLHEQYYGFVRSATCYKVGSDIPLPGGLTSDGAAVVIEAAPADADVLDVVLEVARSDESVFKAAMTIRLLRTDSQEQSSRDDS